MENLIKAISISMLISGSFMTHAMDREQELIDREASKFGLTGKKFLKYIIIFETQQIQENPQLESQIKSLSLEERAQRLTLEIQIASSVKEYVTLFGDTYRNLEDLENSNGMTYSSDRIDPFILDYLKIYDAVQNSYFSKRPFSEVRTNSNFEELKDPNFTDSKKLFNI